MRTKFSKMVTGCLGLMVTIALAGGTPVAGAIVVDGNISDWDDVPTLATSIDNGITASADFATLKVAHDDNFVYFLYTLHTDFNPQTSPGGGVFLSIDSDNNTSTGFNVFSLGVVGSEAAWQNDFPFEQATGVFNTGAGLTNATYAASPFGAVTSLVEISIPRNAQRNTGPADIFPADGGTIGVIFYTDAGADLDYINGSYTFAVPEPASALMLGMGGLAMMVRRRSTNHS